MGKKLEEFDLFWLEEPLNPDDIMGHKKLADALNVPIALGEHVYNKYAFRDYIHQGAIEYCQVDVHAWAVLRNGCRWLACCSYDVPICPHVGDMGQIHQHLVASTQMQSCLSTFHGFVIYLKNRYGEKWLLCSSACSVYLTEVIPQFFDKYR